MPASPFCNCYCCYYETGIALCGTEKFAVTEAANQDFYLGKNMEYEEESALFEIIRNFEIIWIIMRKTKKGFEV